VTDVARQHWSIAERATWWFAITTTAVVLLISSWAATEVYRSKERVLEALVYQDLSELQTRFEPTEGLESAGAGASYFTQRREDFAQIVLALQAQHPDNAIALRVWDATDGHALGDFGSVELLKRGAPDGRPTDETIRLPGHLRSRTHNFPSGIYVGEVLSGDEQYREWQRFLAAAIVLAVISGCAAYFSGKHFIRRACEYMHELAERTRAVRDSHEAVRLEPGDVPREIEELVQALDEMLRNIRAEQERVRLMTAGLAHELGSPLQNLIGETEVALMGPKDADEYQRVLKSHLEELRDIGHAIGNLMTLVSISQHAGTRAAETFDLGQEARLRLRRERAHAERRGTELEVAEAGELTLTGDREALWLVVSNLVANAIDYTPPGGRVKLEMRGEHDLVRVLVDDSGPGIPEDQRARIFEAFYRGPKARGRRAGYGLGLSIVKQAIDAHGGSVSVETSSLGGARFRVELPRRYGARLDFDAAAASKSSLAPYR
jgi:signal transduction histidine kinase